MIEKGVVKAQDVKIIWTSDPLPNDALAVSKGLDAETVKKLRDIVAGITEEQAKAIMPNHYTGWIAATHASYKLIENAGIAVGRIKTAASKLEGASDNVWPPTQHKCMPKTEASGIACGSRPTFLAELHSTCIFRKSISLSCGLGFRALPRGPRPVGP